MSEAVKKLWILSEDEYLQERVHSLPKKKIEKQAARAFDVAKGMEKGLKDGTDIHTMNRYTKWGQEKITALKRRLN